MRKFFLVLSIFILIMLLSAGIHQKVNKTGSDSLNMQADSVKSYAIIR